jgi:multidrug efflux pump subunit AcrA (membrane-fusion protein)
MSTNNVEDKNTALIDVELPHWAARGLAYFLILLFAAGVIASLVITVPETVSASFVLVPRNGTDPIRALRGGIVTQVRVSEGQSVTQGETLFVVKSEVAASKNADLESLATQSRGSEESLALATRKYADQKLAYAQEERKLSNRMASLDDMIAFKNKELALSRTIVERYEQLSKDGLVSAVDDTRNRIAMNRLASEIEELKAEQKQVAMTIDKLAHEAAVLQTEYRERERGFKEETEKAQIRMGSMKEALFMGQGNQVAILAPHSGTILSLGVKAPGAIVSEGDALCEMVAENDTVEAELSVPEWGMGRIKNGQRVRLLYDAFPYQRFGIRYGSVRWISPSTSLSKEKQGFRALTEIKDEAIQVDGQPRSLLPGMSGKAEIVVGRRSLISYAFEPIRQLRENLRQDPETP